MRERPFWEELSTLLRHQEEQPDRRTSPEEARRFHYLYLRISSDLVKLRTFAGEVEVVRYLEDLVARTYGRLNEGDTSRVHFRPWHWLIYTFPCTFRRHWIAFALSFGTFLIGAAFGGGIVTLHPGAKVDLLPPQFSHLQEKPSARVTREENTEFDAFKGRHTFSATLIANNTKVTLLAMASGVLWGVFTYALLFGNGLILGLVIADYLSDGQGQFLAAWLLPHGSFELPAIFIGGQAGLVIARAMFGWGTNLRLRQRFARIRADLLTLILGAALMLVWAGVIESFLSQYHGLAVYPWKIGFGCFELTALTLYLLLCGRSKFAETSPRQA